MRKLLLRRQSEGPDSGSVEAVSVDEDRAQMIPVEN